LFQGYKKVYYILLCLMAFSSLVLSEDIDSLLSEYNQKNRLSTKTIDENKGSLILFTRDDIEKMHATRLKDIFKTLPLVYYHENRYALPDPLTSGSSEFYKSSFIRIFIDGVEVTQGWIGSGLVVYGDINIDFADHIEFYYTMPSFESFIEPAYMTIYMYSKDPSRDEGTVVKLSQGSRGYSEQSMSYGKDDGDISYMINLSHTNAKREKIDNGIDTPLSRDFEESLFFVHIKNDNQSFHLQVVDKKTDSLAGASWDATPLESSMDYLNINMDYTIKFDEYWKMSISYDWLKTRLDQEDDNSLMIPMANGSNSLHGYSINDTLTSDLTYTNTINDNHLIFGVKGRYKRLQYIKLDGEAAETPDFNWEKIFSVFCQDQYVINSSHLVSLGLSYTYIDRNGGMDDNELFQFRLGYIYNFDKFTYKTYIFRTEFAVEPTMSSYNFQYNDDVDHQSTYGISTEFKYQTLLSKLRLGLIYMRDHNSLMHIDVENDKRDTIYFVSLLDGEYKFDIDNKIAFLIYTSHYKHIYSYDTLDDVSAYISFFNTYKNIDFYNGFIWHIDSLDWKSYIDWTSTISWNINENLSITLKGENILGRAKESTIVRFDPSSPSKDILEEPLHISPIDRSVSLNVEYRF